MLPLALVIALSPIPIVAVIAILFSPHPKPNGLSFLGGWITGVAGGLAVTTMLISTDDLGSEASPSASATALRLVLGLLLLAGALRSWSKRPRPGHEVSMPTWMARVDGIGPGGSFVLAAIVGSVNPKNLVMNAAAAAILAAAALPPGDVAVSIALYTAVASSTVAAVVLYRLVAGQRGAARLESIRSWLTANNATVMTLLLLVLGVKLVGDAISGM